MQRCQKIQLFASLNMETLICYVLDHIKLSIFGFGSKQGNKDNL